MSISWPQGIMMFLLLGSFFNGARRFWQKDGWIDTVAVSIGISVQVGILWWGGFWK